MVGSKSNTVSIFFGQRAE